MITIDARALQNLQKQNVLAQMPGQNGKAPLPVSRQTQVFGNIAAGLGLLVIISVIMVIFYYESSEKEVFAMESRELDSHDETDQDNHKEIGKGQKQRRMLPSKAHHKLITPVMIRMRERDHEEENDEHHADKSNLDSYHRSKIKRKNQIKLVQRIAIGIRSN